LVSTYGSYISFAATLVFFFAIVYALFFGKKAAANPWGEGADTLEWTLSSPPPFHQFETLPEFKE
ncbi:cytochrome c oxidase subunit I, partial [Pelagibacteraceae bacterium]|nr:cytochrome c oxidase subunit I [Pelagibacteraceae bacterium]